MQERSWHYNFRVLTVQSKPSGCSRTSDNNKNRIRNEMLIRINTVSLQNLRRIDLTSLPGKPFLKWRQSIHTYSGRNVFRKHRKRNRQLFVRLFVYSCVFVSACAYFYIHLSLSECKRALTEGIRKLSTNKQIENKYAMMARNEFKKKRRLLMYLAQINLRRERNSVDALIVYNSPSAPI